MRKIFNQFQKRRQRKRAINQLEELVRTQSSKMYRIALSYTHSPQDTLDVLQTSFNKALKAIDQQPNLVINDPAAWYYRILINSCRDFWRMQQHQPIKANFDLEKMMLPTPQIASFELREIIDLLDSPAKEIIILKFFEGFTLQVIGTILNLNVNTVKTKMYRALNELRRILEKGGY